MNIRCSTMWMLWFAIAELVEHRDVPCRYYYIEDREARDRPGKPSRNARDRRISQDRRSIHPGKPARRSGGIASVSSRCCTMCALNR
jgi:hypothetical protein